MASSYGFAVAERRRTSGPRSTIPKRSPEARVRRAGIYVPIVPGVLPVHNFAQVANFSKRAGALVPAWLAERFEGLEKDPQTHALVAAAVAAEQVLDLIERGVSDFKGRFFAMNDCRLSPRPQVPIKLICAGQSDAGLEFTARHADYNFCFGKGFNTPTACADTSRCRSW